MAHVTIDESADLSAWVWVPLAFPSGDWPDAEAWVAEVVAAVAVDDVPSTIAAWTSRARTAATTPSAWDGVVARAWHLPVGGAASMLLADVALAQASEADDAGELALAGLEQGMLQRLDAVEHPTLADATATIGVGSAPGGTQVVTARWSGTSEGVRLLVDVAAGDPGLLAVVGDDASALFRALGVVAAD